MRRRSPLAALLALSAALALACSEPPSEDVSVLLISADSLRADRLPPWGVADAPATPALERLAARGTLYRNAWAASPWTAPSMVSVMTGLYPPSHGIVYRDDTTPASLPTLPRLLAARGYRLGNFSFFSQISYFRNLGLGPAEKGGGHARVARSFRRWLGGVPAEEPFFAWVHLLEPHLPYGATGYRAARARVPGSSGLVAAQLQATVPVETVSFDPGDRERLLALYDRDVRAMDRALGKVLAALATHGREESTLVVFVADHGEELLEYGWIGHASTAVEARLVPEILRVPLVLAGPGVPAGEVRDEPVHQVDVVPTVGRLLGLDLPAELDGRPLPGTGSSWTSWLPWSDRERMLFFDSSPGGNLTPQERRGDRLQGVSDGETCLLVKESTEGRPEEVRLRPLSAAEAAACGPEARARLEPALERWRREQTAQRLAILGRHPEGGAPPAEEVDRYAERIELLEPDVSAPLDWHATGGQIAIEWTGRGEAYWLEYHLSDLLRTSGSFRLDQQRVLFGPIPQGFWNDLAAYSPFRVRLIDPENRERSPWFDVELLPAG